MSSSSPEVTLINPLPAKKFKQSRLSFGGLTSTGASSSDHATSPPSSDVGVSSNCVAECCSNDQGLVPFQPDDTGTIERTRKQQGTKSRLFRPSWYSDYPWLTLCTTRARVFCVYCRYCCVHGLLMSMKEDAFVNNGFNNWKKALESFNQHAKSRIHKESILKIQSIKQDSVLSLLNKHARVEQREHRENLLRQLTSLRYLLRQGMAIRGHDDMESNLMQLLKLRSNDCPQLEVWIRERKYFSPVILNEQIAIMGRSLILKLLSDIRSAEWFSLIADESSDVSNKEQLAVCFRWVDKDYTVHEDPVELIQLPKTDATTITGALKDCLIRLSNPVTQCRGQAYDGASNMAGHLSGVAARIQSEHPSALFVHCFAHCANLCLQTIGCQCVPVRDALDLVMELAQLIRFSPKRSSLFESLKAQLSPGSPSLKPLCPTRWTVRTAAINSVLENYKLLCETLAEVNSTTSDEYGRKAGGFLAQMEKFSTYFGLKLAHLVFAGSEQLSITLQGKDTTIQEAITASELAVRHLQRLRSDSSFDTFYASVVESANDLTSPPSLPRYRTPPKKPGDASSSSHRFPTPESYFKKQYFEVFDLLTNELKRRFSQERGVSVAAMIEKVLLSASNGTFEKLPDGLQIYKNDVDFERLTVQLKMIPDLLSTRNAQVGSIPIREVTNVRTLSEVMNELSVSKGMLSQVDRLIRIFFTIPITTSTAERTFSTLRRLKTYLRSTMTQQRLNNTMLLYIHKDRADEIDLSAVSHDLIQVNERRRNYFGAID